MSEVAERTDIPQQTPHDRVRLFLAELDDHPEAGQIKNLIAWFPTEERQKEIQEADTDTQAEFVASILGRAVKWSDSVTFLDMWRPQDGNGTRGEKFGLDQYQAIDIAPITNNISRALLTYIDDMIENTLDDNLELISSKIHFASEALGLNSVVVRRRTGYCFDSCRVHSSRR